MFPSCKIVLASCFTKVSNVWGDKSFFSSLMPDLVFSLVRTCSGVLTCSFAYTFQPLQHVLVPVSLLFAARSVALTDSGTEVAL